MVAAAAMGGGEGAEVPWAWELPRRGSGPPDLPAPPPPPAEDARHPQGASTAIVLEADHMLVACIPTRVRPSRAVCCDDVRVAEELGKRRAEILSALFQLSFWFRRL